jgi:hypothetical protein
MTALHFRPALTAAAALATLTFAGSGAMADVQPALRGLAVLAEGDTAAAASSLARAVYGDPALIPPGLSEARARAMVGDPVAPDAPRELRDLADTRAAIHGDDAPSRSLLLSLAATLHVKGVLVVEGGTASKPAARVFVAGSASFDPVVYESDPAAVATWGSGATAVTWTGALAALHRGFAEASATSPVLIPAPTAALATVPDAAPSEKPADGGRPFYTSPWFWGAIGAAAFAGAAFYFATRDSSDPNIQLSVQVPK